MKCCYIAICAVIVAIAMIGEALSKQRDKPWIGFEYIPQYNERPESTRVSFSARHDQHAIDVKKEYRDSIYITRWYNASFVCQIPLFSFTLPQRGRTGQVRPSSIGMNLGIPFIQGLFVLAGIALYSPIIFPEERRRSLSEITLNYNSINQFFENQMHYMSESPIARSMRSGEKLTMFYFLEKNLNVAFESVLNSIEQLLQYLPYFVKTKLQNCFQWSVCQLYNKPKKYGVVGLLFRAVFPYNNDLDNKSSNVISNYRLAAVYGKNQTNSCRKRFKGCAVTKWEVIRQLLYFGLGQAEHKVTRTQKSVFLFLVDHIFSYLDS